MLAFWWAAVELLIFFLTILVSVIGFLWVMNKVMKVKRSKIWAKK